MNSRSIPGIFMQKKRRHHSIFPFCGRSEYFSYFSVVCWAKQTRKKLPNIIRYSESQDLLTFGILGPLRIKYACRHFCPHGNLGTLSWEGLDGVGVDRVGGNYRNPISFILLAFLFFFVCLSFSALSGKKKLRFTEIRPRQHRRHSNLPSKKLSSNS